MVSAAVYTLHTWCLSPSGPRAAASYGRLLKCETSPIGFVWIVQDFLPPRRLVVCVLLPLADPGAGGGMGALPISFLGGWYYKLAPPPNISGNLALEIKIKEKPVSKNLKKTG